MLRHQLEHGGEGDLTLIKRYAKQGQPLPKNLQHQPLLVECLVPFLRAFWHLNGDRHDGGRIPWSSAMAWADRNGLSPDEADHLLHHLGELDGVYLPWLAAKRSKGGTGPTAPAKRIGVKRRD